ncbi:hypothetical protein [Alteromonas gracilis]|uniref:hypothetical protein n=1 Tax=Alteromonas gracilis TaxID=1479524 RepID=UPI0037353B3E
MTVSQRDWKTIIGASFAFGTGIWFMADNFWIKPLERDLVRKETEIASMKNNIKATDEYLSLQKESISNAEKLRFTENQLQRCTLSNVEQETLKNKVSGLENDLLQAKGCQSKFNELYRKHAESQAKLKATYEQLENYKNALEMKNNTIERLSVSSDLLGQLEYLKKQQDDVESELETLLGYWQDTQKHINEKSRLENRIKLLQEQITLLVQRINN